MSTDGAVGLRVVVGRSSGWQVAVNIRGLPAYELIRSANVNVNARIEMGVSTVWESPWSCPKSTFQKPLLLGYPGIRRAPGLKNVQVKA